MSSDGAFVSGLFTALSGLAGAAIGVAADRFHRSRQENKRAQAVLKREQYAHENSLLAKLGKATKLLNQAEMDANDDRIGSAKDNLNDASALIREIKILMREEEQVVLNAQTKYKQYLGDIQAAEQLIDRIQSAIAKIETQKTKEKLTQELTDIQLLQQQHQERLDAITKELASLDLQVPNERKHDKESHHDKSGRSPAELVDPSSLSVQSVVLVSPPSSSSANASTSASSTSVDTAVALSAPSPSVLANLSTLERVAGEQTGGLSVSLSSAPANSTFTELSS